MRLPVALTRGSSQACAARLTTRDGCDIPSRALGVAWSRSQERGSSSAAIRYVSSCSSSPTGSRRVDTMARDSVNTLSASSPSPRTIIDLSIGEDPPRGAGHGCRGSGARKCGETGTSVMPASRAARLTRFHALTALIGKTRSSPKVSSVRSARSSSRPEKTGGWRLGAHAAAIMPGFQRAIVARHSSLRTRVRICKR